MPFHNRKQSLIELKPDCVQLDSFTYPQPPLSLSIDGTNSQTDASTTLSPMYMAQLQLYMDNAIKTTLLTPELLRYDCFSSYLASQDFNSPSSDCLANSAVFLSTIYEESNEALSEHSASSCTPCIKTLCVVRQDKWHAIQSLSLFHDQDMGSY